MQLDYEQVAMELLRALRGRRSQVAWSRRLGYRSNVAYAWESGRRWPTAAETLRAAQRAGVDVSGSLIRFYADPPHWLESVDPTSPEGVARLLEDLRGSTTVSALADRTGASRYAVSRWLSGRTQPRLPDFLALVEAASLRLVDLLETLVDPTLLPSVAPVWERLRSRRRSAFVQPWTQAVLRALELKDYLALPAHDDAWIAARLGLPIEVVADCLRLLADTGQVTWTGSRWQQDVLAVDTRLAPEAGQALRAHWTGVAGDRIREGRPGQYSYNVFTVSDEDFERIRELHLAYFRSLRAIVAASEPGERVAVVNVQLFALDEG